jgi:hypothetical protein
MASIRMPRVPYVLAAFIEGGTDPSVIDSGPPGSGPSTVFGTVQSMPASSGRLLPANCVLDDSSHHPCPHASDTRLSCKDMEHLPPLCVAATSTLNTLTDVCCEESP